MWASRCTWRHTVVFACKKKIHAVCWTETLNPTRVVASWYVFTHLPVLGFCFLLFSAKLVGVWVISSYHEQTGSRSTEESWASDFSGGEKPEIFENIQNSWVCAWTTNWSGPPGPRILLWKGETQARLPEGGGVVQCVLHAATRRWLLGAVVFWGGTTARQETRMCWTNYKSLEAWRQKQSQWLVAPQETNQMLWSGFCRDGS